MKILERVEVPLCVSLEQQPVRRDGDYVRRKRDQSRSALC